MAMNAANSENIFQAPNLMDYDFVHDGFDPRTVAVIYNASSAVSIATVVLGIFFALTAIGLIAYYLSTLGGGASTIGKRSYNYFGQ